MSIETESDTTAAHTQLTERDLNVSIATLYRKYREALDGLAYTWCVSRSQMGTPEHFGKHDYWVRRKDEASRKLRAALENAETRQDVPPSAMSPDEIQAELADLRRARERDVSVIARMARQMDEKDAEIRRLREILGPATGLAQEAANG